MTTTTIIFACISICSFIYGITRYLVTITDALITKKHYNLTEPYTYVVLGAIGFFLCLVL